MVTVLNVVITFIRGQTAKFHMPGGCNSADLRVQSAAGSKPASRRRASRWGTARSPGGALAEELGVSSVRWGSPGPAGRAGTRRPTVSGHRQGEEGRVWLHAVQGGLVERGQRGSVERGRAQALAGAGGVGPVVSWVQQGPSAAPPPPGSPPHRPHRLPGDRVAARSDLAAPA